MSSEQTCTRTYDLADIGAMTAREFDAFMDAELLRLRNAALSFKIESDAAQKRKRDGEASAKREKTRLANKAKAQAPAPAPGTGEG